MLLGLAFDAIGARERRTLEVLKVRGAAPLPGWHTLTISDDGVTIHPRIEARVARQTGLRHILAAQRAPEAPHQEPGPAGERDNGDEGEPVTTGVPGLDPLLDGGFPRGSSTLVVGARGAGKTLLGLQFALEGARQGEPGLFLSFRETADQLARKTTPFGWEGLFREALGAGTLTILRTPPVELNADALADTLIARLDETGARRLVVDEVGELERALVALGYEHRFHDFAAALVEAFRLRGVTALLTRQTAAGSRTALEQGIAPLTLLTETLLWMREWTDDGHIARSMEILQTAISGRTDVWHPMMIEASRGIIIHHRENQKDAADMRKSGARGPGARQSRDPDKEGRDVDE